MSRQGTVPKLSHIPCVGLNQLNAAILKRSAQSKHLSVCESQPSTAKLCSPGTSCVLPPPGHSQGTTHSVTKSFGDLAQTVEMHFDMFCFVHSLKKPKPLTELSLHFLFKKLRFKLIKKVTEFSCAQRKNPTTCTHPLSLVRFQPFALLTRSPNQTILLWGKD